MWFLLFLRSVHAFRSVPHSSIHPPPETHSKRIPSIADFHHPSVIIFFRSYPCFYSSHTHHTGNKAFVVLLPQRMSPIQIGPIHDVSIFKGIEIAPISPSGATQIVIIFARSVVRLIGGCSVCHEASLQRTLFASFHSVPFRSAPFHPPPPRV